MQPRLFTIVFVLVCFVLIRNELVQSIFAETFTEVLVKTQVTNLSAILRQNLRQLKSPPTKTDKGAGSVPNATIRLVEIQTQNIYRYDNSGLLAESIDRFGNSMRYEYDKLDRRTKTITPTLDPKLTKAITETVYDVAGNIIKQIDPYGYVTEYFYNPFGENVKTIQTDDDRRGTTRQLVTQNRYDKFGRIIETINPAGNKTQYKYDLRGRRIETINSLGQSAKTEYDKRGNIVAQIDVAGNKTTYNYNLQGQRTATILPKPNDKDSPIVMRQFTDVRGRLLSTVSAGGVVDSFLYDKYGRNSANFKGVLLERPTHIENGKSIFTFYNLLANDDYDLFVTWKPDPNAGKVTVNMTYSESFGKRATKSLGEIDLSKKPVKDSFMVPFCRDVYQRLVGNTKIFSDTIKLEFSGEVKNVSVYALRPQAMSRTIYNKNGQPQSQIDARGNSIVYTYDKFGRQAAIIRDGEEKSCCSEGKTFYNRFGQTFATLAPDGRLTIFGYDKLGRQNCTYSGAIAEIKSGEYKLEGLPVDEEFIIFVTKNKNDVIADHLVRIELGDLLFVEEKTVHTTGTTLTGKTSIQSGQIAIIRKQPMQKVEHDFAGRTVASYDANNNQTLYFYDSLGRRVVVMQPPAGEDQTRLAKEIYFDPSGNTIAQILVPFNKDTLKPIAEKKRVTRMEYDKLGRVTKIIQPHHSLQADGPITYQQYDDAGNLVKTIDPLGNETNYRYDNLGRKISETNAEGGVTKFTYYQDGQMKSLTDPVGNRTSWTYNLLGRVSRETITLDKKLCTRFFYYDANGNITTKLDRNNRLTTWTYDKLNRPTSENWYETWSSFYTNKPPIKKFQTIYNNKGKIASTEDDNNKFTFSYGIFGNEIKRVQKLADLEKPVEFNFVTNINGLKTEKILNIDGKLDHKNKYEFDELNRTTEIVQSLDQFTIKSVQIKYDDFGQLAKQTRLDSGKPIIVTKNKFDNAGRLLNISHTGDNKTYADYDIKWDDGNRITDFDFTYLNGPAKKNTSNYSYDKTAQLINASYSFMPNEKYNFDLNGNRKTAEIQGQNQNYKTGEYNRLLSDNENTYNYDNEGNRISKTTKDNKTTKYFWDHRNRLTKVETQTETIEYIYDHQNRLVKRTNNQNTTTFIHDDWQIIATLDSTGKLQSRYLWGTKQDELICNNDNWTLNDHLNTIRDIIKPDGNVESHLEYNAFGKLISETKNDQLRFAYTGKLFDKISDLQWNINRWYDSNAGRWVSEDPIGFEAMDANLYKYVRNKQVWVSDSNGLASNPVSQFSCCKEFDVFYNLVPGVVASMSDWQKGSICRNYLLDGVWWNNVDVTAISVIIDGLLLAGAKSSTPVTIPLIINPPMGTSITVTTIETTVGAVAGPLAAGVTIGSLLGYSFSVAHAGLICNSWFCKQNGGQPNCVCNSGNLWGYSWQCRCPYEQEIYKHNNIGRYSLHPGYDGSNVTYVGQNW